MESMSYEEIFAMVLGMGFPAAYNHFPNDTRRKPPYVCFYYPSSDVYAADNQNYIKRERLYIELYTAEKDFQAEAAVESALREHGIVYERGETYIDAERLYMQLYTMEIIITED